MRGHLAQEKGYTNIGEYRQASPEPSSNRAHALSAEICRQRDTGLARGRMGSDARKRAACNGAGRLGFKHKSPRFFMMASRADRWGSSFRS